MKHFDTIARICGFNWIALILSSLSFLFTSLILVSGITSHVLLDNYFISTNVENLNVPSTLADSTFLSDLSIITGTDFVGSAATPKTLRLAKTYTTHLFTVCAEDDESSTCTKFKFGDIFNPATELKLEGTSFQSQVSSGYSSQIAAYQRVSKFFSTAYIIAAICNGLAVILILVSGYFPSSAVWGRVFTATAMLFLFMASVSAIVKYGQVKNLFDNTFGNAGLQTTLGQRIYIFSFVALLQAIVATISLSFSTKRMAAMRQGAAPGVVSGIAPRSGLLARIPALGRPKYLQVEKQPADFNQRSLSPGNDRRGLVAAAEDDFSHEYPECIAMGPMKSSDRDLRNYHTAYEPYSR